MRRLALLLLPALLVFSACGDDSNDSGSASDATTTSSAPSDDKAPDAEGDQKLADAVVLKLADFPTGWTEGEAPTKDKDSSNDPIDKCFGGAGQSLDANTSAQADSPDFSQGETTTVSSFSAVMKKESNAEDAMNLLRSDKLKDCFDQALADEIKSTAGSDEGFTLGDVTLKNVSFTKVAEDTTALEFVIPISAPGVKVSFYADLVFFRQDRVIGGLFLGNLNTPLTSSQGESLAKKMAARMKAA